MTNKTYPELKEYQDFADAMKKDLEVTFSDSDTKGIYDVNVAIGGVTPVGPMFFSFDKKHIFNFWPDYPDKLTADQIKLFNKYNPTLAELKDFGGYPPEEEQAQDSRPENIWDTRF